MDDVISPNIVHEAEAQRQHPRVRIPGSVFIAQNGVEQRFALNDISAGGLSFAASASAGSKFLPGQRLEARLAFTLTPVSLVLPVSLQIRHLDGGGQRIGAAFEDLGPQEISVLRQLIGGTLTGDLTVTGDVITALSRDNFVKARVAKDAGSGLSGGARLRAVAMTAVMLVIGVAAFVYAASKIYEMAFVTRATQAKIASPNFDMTMPRDGTFFSLVSRGGSIKKGRQIGSFQAAMLDVVQSNLGVLHLSPQQLSDLMGQQMKGTLSSPCDCKVQEQFAFDGEFVNRGQPLFELVPTGARPYVLARFHFEDINKLPLGKTLAFTISGEPGEYFGKLRDVRLLAATGAAGAGPSDIRGLNNPGVTADVIATIVPDRPLDPKLIDRPAQVELGSFGSLLAYFHRGAGK